MGSFQKAFQKDGQKSENFQLNFWKEFMISIGSVDIDGLG